MARKPSKQQPPVSEEVKVEAPVKEVSTTSEPTELNPETYGAKRAEIQTVEVEGAPVTFGVITY